jgi:threonine dehydrogenase-like Zn-dependent dehydrogenase
VLDEVVFDGLIAFGQYEGPARPAEAVLTQESDFREEATQRTHGVGAGAVGLLGVLSARQMGAERLIAMSRHEQRQRLARAFGATDIVAERGDEGVQRVADMTRGVGADSVLECVGTPESMT